MDSVAISVPEKATLASSVEPVVTLAQGLEVFDQVSHQVGQNLLLAIAEAQTKIVDHYRNSKDLAFRTHRAICSDENALLDPLKRARALVSGKLAQYESEARRKAEAASREAEARERARIEENALAAALEAQEAGDHNAAQSLLEDAVSSDVPVVRVEPELAKAEGVSVRETYTAEVVDLLALACHCVSTGSVYLLQANTTALNQLARAHKENLKIPGVRLVKSTVHAVRTR